MMISKMCSFELENLISSADLGIALYKTTNANDRLVAFSASKIAYYTQCRTPMIAFDSESFRELMNAYKCGELIDTIDEITRKVEKILANYDSYKKQAFMAFRQYHDFNENFKTFIVDFDCFIQKNECAVENKNMRIYAG